MHHFAAYENGQPVGFGRAIDMRAGVALMGGDVAPSARRRGVYRALVHARWEHAVARGTPLLVVQAGHMSAPVLTGLGFQSHGVLALFVDPKSRARQGSSARACASSTVDPLTRARLIASVESLARFVVTAGRRERAAEPDRPPRAQEKVPAVPRARPRAAPRAIASSCATVGGREPRPHQSDRGGRQPVVLRR